jgi:hypothetical protein
VSDRSICFVAGAAQAMQMDSGGSATLWIEGLGVVNSNRGHLRDVFSGLFVVQ